MYSYSCREKNNNIEKNIMQMSIKLNKFFCFRFEAVMQHYQTAVLKHSPLFSNGWAWLATSFLIKATSLYGNSKVNFVYLLSRLNVLKK